MRIFHNIYLPIIIVLLLVSFWASPDFQTIAAGVSIFLFGMYFLEQGFNAFTGGLLEKLLAKSTNKLWKSISFGMVSTTVMQSSSLVSVISISFVSAGLISLAAGIGIVFGANLGTTTGAWLIAGFGLKVKISAYAMPMLVIGLILTFQKSKQLRGFGYILAGLGFLFLGIHYMKEGFEAFKDQINLAEFAIYGIKGLLIYTSIGILATVVMQSSHATMVLIITALSLQHVTYENAIALAIGANVGTTITAILGSLNANYQGKQLAGAHLIFNVATGVVAIFGISYITQLVDIISAYVGINPENFTLKLAVFHTLFNLIGIMVMSPFIGQMVIYLEKMIKPVTRHISEPAFLNEASLDYPATLLQSLRKEIIHLYHNTSSLIVSALQMDHSILKSVKTEQDIQNSLQPRNDDFEEGYYTSVKPLIASIIEFSGRGQKSLTAEQKSQLFELRMACVKLSESVKSIDGLRHNMKRFFNSENKAIRNEYNKMRLLIVSVLKELNMLENDEAYDSSVLLNLEDIRVKIKKYRKETNARLDELIRKGKIDSVTAASILNDRTFSRDASKRLLDAGRILFSTRDLEMKMAEEIISLSEKDIEEIVNSGDAV